MTIHPRDLQRMHQGAVFYAAADRSDPFTYNRVITHTQNGVAGFRFNEITGERQDAFYSAEPYQEDRVHPMTGEHYKMTVYKNMKRP